MIPAHLEAAFFPDLDRLIARLEAFGLKISVLSAFMAMYTREIFCGGTGRCSSIWTTPVTVRLSRIYG